MRKGIVLFLVCCLGGHALAGSGVLRKYFFTTYKGLECMRHPSGLIMDKVLVTQEDKPCPVTPGTYTDTSPTNLAFDLLVQVEALNDPLLFSRAMKNIRTTLKTVGELSYHVPSGLFFNRYRVDGDHRATDLFVSAVDNAHLYLALWTLSQAPYSFVRAQELLKRMDLAVFHDPGTDLAFGGIEWRNGQWRMVEWGYRYLGTEARTLYALAKAIDLFPTDKITKNLLAELFIDPQLGELFGLWDGGTFQLLLPELLIKESHYSTKFQKWSQNYLSFVEREKNRRGLDVLPTHSACQTKAVPNQYNGRLGSLDLVSSFNLDSLFPAFRRVWEQVVSPHATFLAAMVDPDRVLPSLEAMENISDGSTLFYNKHVGWLDGVHVNGPSKGYLVASVLSLDQGMIALATAQMMAQDRMLTPSRLLARDSQRSNRLRELYLQIEEFMDYTSQNNLPLSFESSKPKYQ